MLRLRPPFSFFFFFFFPLFCLASYLNHAACLPSFIHYDYPASLRLAWTLGFVYHPLNINIAHCYFTVIYIETSTNCCNSHDTTNKPGLIYLKFFKGTYSSEVDIRIPHFSLRTSMVLSSPFIDFKLIQLPLIKE